MDRYVSRDWHGIPLPPVCLSCPVSTAGVIAFALLLRTGMPTSTAYVEMYCRHAPSQWSWDRYQYHCLLTWPEMRPRRRHSWIRVQLITRLTLALGWQINCRTSCSPRVSMRCEISHGNFSSAREDSGRTHGTGQLAICNIP